MGNSIKPHIENAQKTGVCQLCKMGVSEFPKQLTPLATSLRTLDLSDNKIAIIPSSIGNFTLLKHLTMNNNRIGSLPEEIGNLKKLESISFAGNHLSRLPPSVSRLVNLKTVTLSNNGILEFPTVLCELGNLEVVDLSKNRITKLQDSVRNLMVTELIVNQNQVSHLSDALGDCPRLKVLRLEENCLQLSAIPKKLLVESQVSLLALDGNLFEAKDLHNVEGYEKYMERYTATKKKIY